LLTDRQNERQRRKQITSLAETRREDYEKKLNYNSDVISHDFIKQV